jgi:hypothetical protein
MTWMGPSLSAATRTSVSSTRAARMRIEAVGRVVTSVTVTSMPRSTKLAISASLTPLKYDSSPKRPKPKKPGIRTIW